MFSFSVVVFKDTDWKEKVKKKKKAFYARLLF